MRHLLKLASVLILLTGCSSGQLTKDQPVSVNSNSGVVVLGMDLQSDFKSPTFGFLRYDPQTGKADPKGLKLVSRSKEDLTGAQKFAAAMSGQTSLAKGRQFFVIELPPGEWILLSVSGFYSDGLSSSYSATSYFSKGTIAFSSTAGAARYLGEYRVTGRFGEAFDLHTLGEDLAAAQAEFKKYPNIELPLQASEPLKASFSCETKKILWGGEMCQWKTVTVQRAASPAGSTLAH
jgi:hypothetical protein